MKCQILLSRKKKENINKLSSVELAQRVVNVKFGLNISYSYNWQMMCNGRKGLLSNLRTTQAQISLRICAGLSGPSLSAYRSNGYSSIFRRTKNVQIRLHGCACSSGLLFAALIWHKGLFPSCASYTNTNMAVTQSDQQHPKEIQKTVLWLM